MKINRGTAGVGAAGTAMLLALAGCDEASIASKDIGPQWPFTVSEVGVVCAPALAIFINSYLLTRHPTDASAGSTLVHETKHLLNYYQRTVVRSAIHPTDGRNRRW